MLRRPTVNSRLFDVTTYCPERTWIRSPRRTRRSSAASSPSRSSPFVPSSRISCLKVARACGRPEMCSRRAAGLTKPLSAADSQQLDLKDERGAALNQGRTSAVAVSDAGRTHQFRLSADLHLLKPFGPAGNHLVEPELRRLSALVRAVKLRPINQCAAILDFDPVSGFGRGAIAGSHLVIDQTTGGSARARRRSGLAEIAFRGGSGGGGG